jgi:hypothetical protein
MFQTAVKPAMPLAAAWAAAVIAFAPATAFAGNWNLEFVPSPAIATSIDGGAVPMRTRIDAIRLTRPVLRNDLAGAGFYWESRIECEGVGFEDFVDAHFSYRTEGVVRIPATNRRAGETDPALVVYFHGGYGPLEGWTPVIPATELEGDTLVAAPSLSRGLAYASFNLAGWDADGNSTAFMLEDSGPARPEDPEDMVDGDTGLLIYPGTAVLRTGDAVNAQTPSVARDLVRATKQAVIAVTHATRLAGWDAGRPDRLTAIIAGHSWGAFLTAGMALGMNPWRPGIPSGGNRLDPADPNSPRIVSAAIHLAPAAEFSYADPKMPLIPMIFINAEADPIFGGQFTIAARYGEVLAARGYGLRDRVSLWSLGNSAHTPPELWLESLADTFGLSSGGDPWRPFFQAALGHVHGFIAAREERDRRMPASHYDGRLVNGNRVVFPQKGGPSTDLVPFIVDPRWDAFDDVFVEPQPFAPHLVDSFAAVARELRPTGHLLGPRMANPIGGYRIDFVGVELAAPFPDLGRRYGSWNSYLERHRKAVADLEAAGVYVAPRGKAALIELLDPAAFDAFKAQGLAGSGQ